MTKNKTLAFLIAGTLLFVSVNYSSYIREKLISVPLAVKSAIVGFSDKLTKQYNAFFDQKKKILELEKELKECKKTALLSTAFASKLNHFLEESKLQKYDPDLHFVRAVSYVKLGDFSKMWIDFPKFKPSLVYGLMYKGFAAGIVEEQDGKPLARLLSNTKTMFSVAIGEKKHLGVVFGGIHYLEVKYIPAYAEVNRGDEVITSGNDNIFYEGIKVGEVIEVQTNNLYKMAIIKPYIEIRNPDFFYVVDINTK